MELTPERLERYRRLGIDPNVSKEELLRQLTEKWQAMARAKAEARKADKPVVVDVGGERV